MLPSLILPLLAVFSYHFIPKSTVFTAISLAGRKQVKIVSSEEEVVAPQMIKEGTHIFLHARE